jgi:hypothetical protein
MPLYDFWTNVFRENVPLNSFVYNKYSIQYRICYNLRYYSRESTISFYQRKHKFLAVTFFPVSLAEKYDF